MYDELFTGVCFPAANKGYAVGAGGMIKSKGAAAAGIGENDATLELTAYPNPFAGNVTVRYELVDGGDATITVYDVSGKALAVTTFDNLSSGAQEYAFDGSMLTAGIYYVQVASGDASATVRMIK
jgi:hypothetical protein